MVPTESRAVLIVLTKHGTNRVKSSADCTDKARFAQHQRAAATLYDTHTHTHTRTHTHTHQHTRTYTHARSHGSKHIHTHINAHTHLCEGVN